MEVAVVAAVEVQGVMKMLQSVAVKEKKQTSLQNSTEGLQDLRKI